MRWIRVISKSLHIATTFLAFVKVGCRVLSSLFGEGLVPYGHLILPSIFSELHAVQLHCWRKCQLNNKLTPPWDVPLSCMWMPYLHPFPCCPVKKFSSTTLSCSKETHLLKVHFNGQNSLSQFPRSSVITRKRRTNSPFWHHFWIGFESSFLNHFPKWKSDNFCGF